MNKELMIFDNGEIRCTQYKGEVWFVGKDITKKLNYSNSSDAIKTHVDEEDKILLSFETQSEFAIELNYKQLGQRGGWLISEDGVFDLIYNSKLPKAKKFKKKVREIITKVQQTGKYDSIEEKLKLIEDEKERELTLGLYSLEQALKVNQNDLSLPIMINQKKLELNNYKQQEQLKQLNNKIIEIENKSNEQENRLNNMLSIGDRVQFTNEVNRISRLTGKQQSEIYNLAYIKLKDMYGIDLNTRVRNRREQIQDKRLSKDKKPYAPSTLKSKINNLVLADELNIWNELGNSLNAVNNELNLN